MVAEQGFIRLPSNDGNFFGHPIKNLSCAPVRVHDHDINNDCSTRIIANEIPLPDPATLFSDEHDAAIIAALGALWGLMEITLGATLKGMRLPMSGALLAGMACMIALTGRYFVRRRGAIVMMGGVAAMLKIFSAGTVIAGPFLAILIESAIAEAVCSLLGCNRRGFALAGAAVLCYTVLHPFITQGLLFGGRVYEVYWATARQVGEWLGLQVVHLTVFIGFYLSVHVLIGCLTGLFAYRLALAVKVELEKLEHSP